MLNMGWIKDPLTSTDSFTIKSGLAGGVYFIDGESENIVATPDLIPDAIDFISPEIARTSNTVNDKVEWTFTIKFSSNALSQTGYLIMTLPDDVLYDTGDDVLAFLTTNSSASAGASITSFTSDAIKTVQITSVCGSSGCALSSLLGIKLTWVKNPPAATTSTDSVIINSYTSQGWLIDEGITSALNTILSTLKPKEIVDIIISPDDPSAGASTNYDIIFTADTNIPQNSIVIITIPPEILISPLNGGGTSSLDT